MHIQSPRKQWKKFYSQFSYVLFFCFFPSHRYMYHYIYIFFVHKRDISYNNNCIFLKRGIVLKQLNSPPKTDKKNVHFSQQQTRKDGKNDIQQILIVFSFLSSFFPLYIFFFVLLLLKKYYCSCLGDE